MDVDMGLPLPRPVQRHGWLRRLILDLGNPGRQGYRRWLLDLVIDPIYPPKRLDDQVRKVSVIGLTLPREIRHRNHFGVDMYDFA